MDWIKEAQEINKICKENIDDFDEKYYCGPNKLIYGDSFDDSIIIYKNLISNKIFIEQTEDIYDLDKLKEILSDLNECLETLN